MKPHFTLPDMIELCDGGDRKTSAGDNAIETCEGGDAPSGKTVSFHEWHARHYNDSAAWSNYQIPHSGQDTRIATPYQTDIATPALTAWGASAAMLTFHLNSRAAAGMGELGDPFAGNLAGLTPTQALLGIGKQSAPGHGILPEGARQPDGLLPQG